MRSYKLVACALGALALLATSTAAWSNGRGHYGGHYHHHSHGSRVHLGFVFGAPLWYPAPVYPYPYAYAYPPAVIVPPAPRVYIERDERVAQESSPGYWYYCRDSNTYYPYVKECASPWERVPAQPQNP